MGLAEFAYHLVNGMSAPSLRDAYLWRLRLDDFADDGGASRPVFFKMLRTTLQRFGARQGVARRWSARKSGTVSLSGEKLP